MDTLLQILIYLIPGLIIFLTTYVVLRAFLDREHKLRLIEFRQANIREALPIRLQAYERLTLFMERIALNNLLPRIRKSGMTVSEFRTALISNIRMEYEHNLSQQVYVSAEAWASVKMAKEEVIGMINQHALDLRPEADSVELSKKMISFLADSNEMTPTSKAIAQLKKDVMLLYER
ncbi:MAG: hypothetical protein ACK4IY_04760 [Chitinophagales bacterium]